MELLQQQCTHILECDTDFFIVENPANLTPYLAVVTALQVQNWLNVWRPFILYTFKKSTELSLQGVHTLQTYFLAGPNNTPHPINSQPHRTACLRLRAQLILPQPFASPHCPHSLVLTPINPPLYTPFPMVGCQILVMPSIVGIGHDTIALSFHDYMVIKSQGRKWDNLVLSWALYHWYLYPYVNCVLFWG
jgi:hypothetical protein